MNPKLVDVVVHTHWDREWYLPRETTLARLLTVMRQVLDQLDGGQLQSFLFDGQTAALQDLLAAAEPELAQRVRQHTAAGRLLLGPWFVAADEFLVSGESLLRNLEIGHHDASSQGRAQRVGYLPDTFGHVAQMPQILAQWGIQHAVVWRGADAVHDSFDWVAPDGTVARTVFLTEGYYLHPLHGPDWATVLPALLQRLAARRAPAGVGALLLPHGGDHLAPSPLLAGRIDAFNAQQNEFALRQITLEEHVLGMPAPARQIHGELRHNGQAFVLPDVLSTRRYLKLAHQLAEDRLLAEVEPLCAQLQVHSAGQAMQRAWRLLIEQQAHDSLCGCSIDAVHVEMVQRFVHLNQQLDALRQHIGVAAGLLTAHRHGPAESALDVWADDTCCSLFNALPQPREGWFDVSVFLKGPAHAALHISTAQGETLAHEVLSVRPHAELVSPLDDFPEQLVGHRYALVLHTALPGLGALALNITGATRRPAEVHAVAPAGIQNSAWRMDLETDGSLHLHDLRSGRHIKNALSLISELDAGDSYNFSPPPAQHSVLARTWTSTGAQQGSVVQELRLTLQMQLPASLDKNRQGASTERVLNKVELRLRLIGDEPQLHCQLTLHNQAQDQRTRLLLPWPAHGIDGIDDSAPPASSFSDTAFAWTERPVQHAQIPTQMSRAEMPVVVMPSLSAITAGPLAIAHRAMQEFEVVQLGGQQHLALTLVRCVGWLSRRDLLTRGVGAGPDLATPGAQNLGTEVFDFRLLALQPGQPSHTALNAAADLRRPPVVQRGHSSQWAAPVDIGNSTVQTSSVRRGPGCALELRLWNPSAQIQPLALGEDDWQAVWADGRPHSSGGATHHSLPPFGILTLRRRP